MRIRASKGRRTPRSLLIALVVASVVASSTVAFAADTQPRRAPGPAPTGYNRTALKPARLPTIQMEAEKFSGDWASASDSGATGGRAVVIKSGALSTSSSLAAGPYTLSVRVRSAGERIVLQVNGKSIGTAMVSGGWTTVTAPVYLPSSFTWGLTPARRTDGGADNPVYVDWLSLTEATAGMTTFGTDIRDASGQKTIPRGVNRNGFEYLANGGGWSSDNDFEGMRSWGATFVRLPLGQQFWVSSSCQYDPAYAARIDQAVQSITSRGMIALVDLHTNYGGKTCGTSGLTPMADQYSIPFWKEVAARYASNPLVAFDLFNEPHWLTDQIWHDGGTVGDYQAVGMQQLYDTVRSTGATNLVFIGGETWAYNIDVALRRPVDGYGIVYSTHLYTDPETDALKVGQDSVVLPVAAQYPVMITEFGSKGHSLYNQNVIDWAEAHGLPWSAWYWYQFPSDYGVLGSFRTYTPSPVGLPVQQGLLKARGWVTPGGGPVAAPGSVFG